MKVVLDHTTDVSSNMRTFWFKPEVPLEYTAGQYIELTLNHKNPDSRGVKRFFTLSSAPGHQLLSITTRYAGNDKSSTFKNALFNLRPGIELDISEPSGEFVLPSDQSVPLVFVAGGIGLTPFHSMLEWLADHSLKRMIRFLYSVRFEEEIIFQETFERAGIHMTIFVEEPSDTWGGERGRPTPEQILAIAEPSPNSLIYISGPEPMVKSFEDGLKSGGVPDKHLVTDFFPGYKTI